ncbi:hypothetical protein [Actinoplanes sp. NPDC026619]|uniref:hypothetical protein n=1 Tax=Actinoplanes sp. NPDC026619 TaxID=3155798 RepID=UPI0033E7C31B
MSVAMCVITVDELIAAGRSATVSIRADVSGERDEVERSSSGSAVVVLTIVARFLAEQGLGVPPWWPPAPDGDADVTPRV